MLESRPAMSSRDNEADVMLPSVSYDFKSWIADAGISLDLAQLLKTFFEKVRRRVIERETGENDPDRG